MSRIAIATTLSAASGGLTSAVVGRLLYEHHNLGVIFNGILSGLVAICASVSVIEIYMAIPIGIVAGILYNVASRLVLHFKIDDPVDAASVHGMGGMWGLLCPGIFASASLMEEGGYDASNYASGRQFGVQLCGLVAILGWTVVNSFIIFRVMDKMFGIRIPLVTEKLGIDQREHGGIRLVDLSTNFRNSRINLIGNLAKVGLSPHQGRGKGKKKQEKAIVPETDVETAIIETTPLEIEDTGELVG